MKDWKRRTIAFLASQGVTLFGSSLVQFAMVWHVTLQTSSGAWVSELTVCSFAPQFVISFFSGAWADRYSRKRLIILADAIIAVATLSLALLMPRIGKDTALYGALLAVSVIRSLGAGIQIPAVGAMIPQLVPERHLMRFNGIHATLQSVVQFAAPAAAGAILTLGTLRGTLFIDVATAAVGIGILSALDIPRISNGSAPVTSSVFVQMREGMQYARTNRLIGKLLLAYGVFIFLSVPAGFLATLFVSRVYGASYTYFTIVELIGFAGMAGGGLLMGTWGGFPNRVKTLLIGLSSFGVLGICMGVIRSFPVYLAAMAVYGVALTMVQTAVTTILQEKTDPDMQGRIFGFLTAMYAGCLPIGMAVFGPLADVVPMRGMMVVTGIAMLLLSAWMRFDQQISRES